MMKRVIFFILCALLLLSFPVNALVCGEVVDSYSVALADDTVLFENRFWSGTDLRTEYYVEAEVGNTVFPNIIASAKLWERQSFSSVIDDMGDKKRTILAGINGGYYTVATGEPVGILMTNGQLYTDDEGLFAVGFQADGSAQFGQPHMRMELINGNRTIQVSSINRAGRVGVSLFSSDYSDLIQLDDNTKGLICTSNDLLSMNGEVNLTIVEKVESGTKVRLSYGQYLITFFDESSDTLDGDSDFAEIESFGNNIRFRNTVDETWIDVKSAVGILYPLVINGELVPSLEKNAAPRTAIGIRDDGSLICYVLDGRQSGYSVGGGLNIVAQRMIELGCTYAGALDGGGSTQLYANLDQERSLKLLNKPSEGKARSVANYLILQTNQVATGVASRLLAAPYSIHAVIGASVPIVVTASDQYGYPANNPEYISYAVTDGLGEIRNGIFYAEKCGTGKILVSAVGCASAEIPVWVSDSPDSMELFGEKYGKKTETLTLDPGQEIDLTVQSKANHVLLSGDDTCYSWTIDENVGTVDEGGHVVAGQFSTRGTLTAGLGECMVQIPITVWSGIPFSDVSKNDYFFEAVKFVYENGIFKGTSDTAFEPDTVMTRGMLVTVLWRMSGEPLEQSLVTFEDVEEGSWYEDSVAWAFNCGLVNGYSASQFAPKDDLTMEQIMTILYRWAGTPESEIKHSDKNWNSLAHEYAVDALFWAETNGIIGKELNELQPSSPMTRAMVAEVLSAWSVYQNKISEQK